MPKYIIDFDSTFVSVESLDELANIALSKHPQRDLIVTRIQEITDLGMKGQLSFADSLAQRLELFSIEQKHIDELINFLKDKITRSFLKNKKFFEQNKENIYIISGGFCDYIVPIVKAFGILENHVLANKFIIKNGKVISYEEDNFLAQTGGKVLAVKSLNLPGDIIVIGDGYTDYEIKKQNPKAQFWAYVENVHRPTVVEKADRILNTFDEAVL